MKKLNKQRLSNILISLGAVMILIGVIYEAANYPWRILLTDWGLMAPQSQLEEPKPLPASAQTPGAFTSNTDETEAMPATPTWLTARPVMDITQLGVIKLPRLSVSENIVEGSADELLYGVGHVRGTAMPGQPGNCVLAGHRNYVIMHPFRHLDKMEAGDAITVSDDVNTYTYEAFKIFQIEPDDTWILQPQEEEENLLTLLTCTPVLNPTHRLIVWCKLTDTQPLAPV